MLTNLVRWDPFRDLATLRADIDRLMTQPPGGAGTAIPPRWSPASDVIETDDAIVITAELPGVKDEDVEITVHEGTLHIRGERRLEEEVREDRFYRIERSYGSFERNFPLPAGVSESDIHAGIAYGVLKVTIPKPAAPEPRRVAISPEG